MQSSSQNDDQQSSFNPNIDTLLNSSINTSNQNAGVQTRERTRFSQQNQQQNQVQSQSIFQINNRRDEINTDGLDSNRFQPQRRNTTHVKRQEQDNTTRRSPYKQSRSVSNYNIQRSLLESNNFSQQPRYRQDQRNRNNIGIIQPQEFNQNYNLNNQRSNTIHHHEIGPVQRQQQIQNRQVNQDQQQIQRDFQHQDQQDGQVQQNQNLYNLVNEFLDFRRHFSWIKFVRSLFCLLIIGSAYYFYTKKNIPEDVRIVLIGSFGSGKSALGNSFLGFDAFETGYSSGALTTQAVEAKSTFLGEQNGKPIYIIDTQGHDDQVGRDVKHASQFIHLLRQKDYINCFVYVINSESPRMNDLTWQRIKYYNSTFTNFWQNLVIVVSRWHFNLEAQRIRDINGLNEQKYKQHLIQTFKDNGFDVKDLDVFYIDVFYNPTSQYQYNKFVNETTRFIDKVSNMVQSNFLENDKYMQLSQQLYKLEIIEIERKRKIEAEQQQKLQKLSELKKELDECEESIWCSMKQKHTDLTEEYQQLLKEIDINSSDAQYEDLQRAINIEKFREIYGMDL